MSPLATGGLVIAAGLGFGFVSGNNDGGTLVSFCTRTSVVTPGTALTTIALLVTLGPFVYVGAVATTVAHSLVSFDGADGRAVLLAAVVGAVATVLLLTRRGLSTSLTLALIGGMVGAGLAGGQRVGWGAVGRVLVIGLAAPLLSVLVAYVLTRALAHLPATLWVGRSGRSLQQGGFLLQSLAYSANDAQKLVAILAIGTQAATYPVAAHWATQVPLGLFYGAGVVIGVRPLARRIGQQVLSVRPANAVMLELSASAVVLASSALGAPISSTQAATGALVGTGLGTASHHLHWAQVANIGLAWVLTLPLTLGAGFLVELMLRGAASSW